MGIGRMAGVSAVVFAVLFAGCEKAPQVEIDKARAAVSEAEGAASVYAAGELAKAKSALDDALAAVKAQDAKMMKNYTEAKAKLSAVIEAAGAARTAALAGMEKAKADATAAVADAKKAVEELKAEAAKATKKAAAEAQAAVAAAEGVLAQAEAALGSSDFADAKSQAMTASAQAAAARTALQPPAKEKKAKGKKGT